MPPPIAVMVMVPSFAPLQVISVDDMFVTDIADGSAIVTALDEAVQPLLSVTVKV